MLDAKLLRNEIERIANELAKRHFILDVASVEQLEQQRRTLQMQLQQWQQQRNSASKAIGQAKAKGEDISEQLATMTAMASQLTTAEQQLHTIQQQLEHVYFSIPNLPHATVPIGASEADNVEIRRWGELPQFSFTPKDHVALGENLALLDFNAAAQLSGSRFVVMYDALARLHRALAQFMLDVHVSEHGYQEVYVPYLVKPECLYGTGQLPKFREDQFWLAGETTLSLIPTAEVPLANLVQNKIIESEQLPISWVAHTPCFRSEAGSYGKDTRGLIRQHQFEKVELVQIVKPEDSYKALEQLTSHAENILKKLQLPYRVMALCTADLGFSAAKTYDLEVWLPGQNQFREISSCSNCEDFQARRMQARWRAHPAEKPSLVHTLNGSGLAVGRTLVAIMENYQDAQGNLHIPTALQKYLQGQKVIQCTK